MNSIKLNVNELVNIDIYGNFLAINIYWKIPRPRFPLGMRESFIWEFTNG